MIRWLGIFFMVCAAGAGVLLIGSRDEEWTLQLTAGEKIRWIGVGALCACCVLCLRNKYFWMDMLMACFSAGLITATVMDLWEQMVYRFVWWAAGAAALVILIARLCAAGRVGGAAGELILYIFLQQTVFVRFYGRADCHAFSVCAVAMAAYGLRLVDYLIHMALAFGILAVIQLACGNVTQSGRLKQPVPLVPYITVAFWLWVDFMAGKWYI